MPSVDFNEWFEHLKTTGSIGSNIQMGISRKELKDYLGEPDDTGGTSRKYKEPMVLKYEDIEFHFSPDDKLCLIYSEKPAGVVHLSIPSW